MEKFRYEFPTAEREKDALEFIEEFRANDSQIHGSGSLEKYESDYAGWIKKIDAEAKGELKEGLVPAETFFLVRESDNKIIGMSSVRLALNHKLWNYGGNIGYCIRPTERQKGYNKINLYLALEVCARHGMEAVLLDCDKDNLGSSKTMRALGGKLIYEYYDENEGRDIQNYVIDVAAALEKYGPTYLPMISELPE